MIKLTVEVTGNTVEEAMDQLKDFTTAHQYVGQNSSDEAKAVKKTSTKKKAEKEAEPEEATANFATEDMYFYHAESDSYWMVKKGEEIPKGIDAEVSTPISKEEYEAGITKAEQPEPEAKPIKIEDVRAVLVKVREAGLDLAGILAPYGGRLPDVKKEDYAALLKDAQDALAKEAA